MSRRPRSGSAAARALDVRVRGLHALAVRLSDRGAAGLGRGAGEGYPAVLRVLAVTAEARAAGSPAVQVLRALDVGTAEQLGQLLELVAGEAMLAVGDVGANVHSVDDVAVLFGFAGPELLAAQAQAVELGTTLAALLDRPSPSAEGSG